MNLTAYFQVFMYILMATLIITLVLIFLSMLYGKEEEKKSGV